MQLDLIIPRQVFSPWVLVSLPRDVSTAEDHVCSSWHGSKMFGTRTLQWSLSHGRKWDPLSLKDRQKQEALGIELDAGDWVSNPIMGIQPKAVHEQR